MEMLNRKVNEGRCISQIGRKGCKLSGGKCRKIGCLNFMKKIKTYNIMLSSVFPVTHPKAGQETGFAQKVMAAINSMPYYPKKFHTIRANYDLWKKRIDEVLAGEAELCLRQWSGKPYRSKTVVIKRLRRYDGVGLQKLSFFRDRDGMTSLKFFNADGMDVDSSLLAQNDGLSVEDWRNWFRGYDFSKPMAIIHFTNFRY